MAADDMKRTRKNALLDALFPATRRYILSTILLHPEKWWFLSEIAQELRTTPSSLERVLPALVTSGILVQRKARKHTFYKAQVACPIYVDLRNIFQKALKSGEAPKRRIVAAYNREALYEEVWTEPLWVLCRRYGISDVALAKACQRQKVPLPGRGYWNKKIAGRPVQDRPELPPI